MSASKIKLKIVNPEHVVFEDMVDSVMVPTTTGQVSILPDHEPMVSLVEQGMMTVKKDGTDITLEITSGFLEVNPESEVVILARGAKLTK